MRRSVLALALLFVLLLTGCRAGTADPAALASLRGWDVNRPLARPAAEAVAVRSPDGAATTLREPISGPAANLSRDLDLAQLPPEAPANRTRPGTAPDAPMWDFDAPLFDLPNVVDLPALAFESVRSAGINLWVLQGLGLVGVIAAVVVFRPR